MITTDDLEDVPHMVVVETDNGLQMAEFEGHDAGTKANQYADSYLGMPGFNGRILVAARYRQLGTIAYAQEKQTWVFR